MIPNNPLLQQTRRHFFRDCGVGVGSMALASLLGRDAPGAAASAAIRWRAATAALSGEGG